MKTILFVLLLILCISQTKNKILCNCGWILIALLLLNSLNEGFTCSDVPVINVPGGTAGPSCPFPCEYQPPDCGVSPTGPTCTGSNDGVPQCTGTHDGVATCTGTHDGDGGACALNADRSACAVPGGGDCTFAEGAPCALNADSSACAVPGGGDCVYDAGSPAGSCKSPDRETCKEWAIRESLRMDGNLLKNTDGDTVSPANIDVSLTRISSSDPGLGMQACSTGVENDKTLKEGHSNTTYLSDDEPSAICCENITCGRWGDLNTCQDNQMMTHSDLACDMTGGENDCSKICCENGPDEDCKLNTEKEDCVSAEHCKYSEGLLQGECDYRDCSELETQDFCNIGSNHRPLPACQWKEGKCSDKNCSDYGNEEECTSAKYPVLLGLLDQNCNWDENTAVCEE